MTAPVARVVPAAPIKKVLPLQRLAKLRPQVPARQGSSAELLRELRDAE
jgi:hypothetical protein